MTQNKVAAVKVYQCNKLINKSSSQSIKWSITESIIRWFIHYFALQRLGYTITVIRL